MKKMGLDLGRARVGIAMSDILGILASPYETLQSKGLDRDVEYVAKLCKDYQVDTVVIGLPLNMDGTDSDMSIYARTFADNLKPKVQANVILQDERLTSVEAEEYLNQTNTRGKKRKAVLDQVAACIILQTFLDTK